jgi:hypothetical protein
MSQVFVSHSSKDRELVKREFVDLLTALGLDTFFAVESIQTAEHWEQHSGGARGFQMVYRRDVEELPGFRLGETRSRLGPQESTYDLHSHSH